MACGVASFESDPMVGCRSTITVAIVCGPDRVRLSTRAATFEAVRADESAAGAVAGVRGAGVSADGIAEFAELTAPFSGTGGPTIPDPVDDGRSGTDGVRTGPTVEPVCDGNANPDERGDTARSTSASDAEGTALTPDEPARADDAGPFAAAADDEGADSEDADSVVSALATADPSWMVSAMPIPHSTSNLSTRQSRNAPFIIAPPVGDREITPSRRQQIFDRDFAARGSVHSQFRMTIYNLLYVVFFSSTTNSRGSPETQLPSDRAGALRPPLDGLLTAHEFAVGRDQRRPPERRFVPRTRESASDLSVIASAEIASCTMNVVTAMACQPMRSRPSVCSASGRLRAQRQWERPSVAVGGASSRLLSGGACTAGAYAAFSRICTPQADPSPMTCANPTRAPSIWRLPASPRRW